MTFIEDKVIDNFFGLADAIEKAGLTADFRDSLTMAIEEAVEQEREKNEKKLVKVLMDWKNKCAHEGYSKLFDDILRDYKALSNNKT